MAICPNNRRDAQTLYDLVSKHVELTSTIHTVAWRGYNGLLTGGFANHLTVNHSLHFEDPITHVHTNNIESRWQYLRHYVWEEFGKTKWTLTFRSIYGAWTVRIMMQTHSKN